MILTLNCEKWPKIFFFVYLREHFLESFQSGDQSFGVIQPVNAQNDFEVVRKDSGCWARQILESLVRNTNWQSFDLNGATNVLNRHFFAIELAT